MNKHHYKDIFDCNWQRSVVVSEPAKSRGKASKTVCLGDMTVFGKRTISTLNLPSPYDDKKVRSNFEVFCDVKNTWKTHRTLFITTVAKCTRVIQARRGNRVLFRLNLVLIFETRNSRFLLWFIRLDLLFYSLAKHSADKCDKRMLPTKYIIQ